MSPAESFVQQLYAAKSPAERDIVMLLIAQRYQGKSWSDEDTARLLARIYGFIASGDNDASLDAYIAIGTGFEANERSVKQLRQWLSPAQFDAWVSLSEVAEDLLIFNFEQDDCWTEWRERVVEFIRFQG